MINRKSNSICLTLLLGLFLLISCSQDEEKANAKLVIAKEYAQKQDFETTRLYVDSIKQYYPNALNANREGQILLWEIEIKELENSIAQLDSLFDVNQHKADSIKQNLLLEKNEEYQTEGIYMTKDQTLEKTMGRSCLRFSVAESGNMRLTAVATGKGKGTFSSIKAETPTGIWGSSSELSKDDSNNFTGEFSQTLTYTRGKDNGFVEFLYTYKDEPLTISFLGSGNPYSYKFSKSEKQALEQTYELSSALLEQRRIRQEQKLMQAKISLVKETMKQFIEIMSR